MYICLIPESREYHFLRKYYTPTAATSVNSLGISGFSYSSDTSISIPKDQNEPLHSPRPSSHAYRPPRSTLASTAKTARSHRPFQPSPLPPKASATNLYFSPVLLYLCATRCAATYPPIRIFREQCIPSRTDYDARKAFSGPHAQSESSNNRSEFGSVGRRCMSFLRLLEGGRNISLSIRLKDDTTTGTRVRLAVVRCFTVGEDKYTCLASSIICVYPPRR